MDDIIKVKSETASKLLSDNEYSIFRSYDIRGVYPEQLDPEISYQSAKAYIKINPGEKYVLAIDMRESSIPIATAIAQAFKEEGKQIDFIGETTSDCFYFVVGKYGYDGGAMVTASHNSAIFNGIKYVKKNASPISVEEVKEAYLELKDSTHYIPEAKNILPDEQPRSDEFIDHVLKFSEGIEIGKMKIVVDAGNGMSGDMVEKLFAKYPHIELIKMYFEPHSDFPHHEANPALKANLIDLQEKVKEVKADLGVALDGDGDRVFFVDSHGEVVPGYYIQALLTEYFLTKYKGEMVVYDTRYTRAIESIIKVCNGRGEFVKAGHSHVKEKMRQEDAIFGGESTSSHFYYRDNFYADSGLITLQVIIKIISETKSGIDELIKSYKERFHASGEKNFLLKDKDQFKYIIDKLKNAFANATFSEFDGFVLDAQDWRLSLRQSNTEPFVRLNIEADNKGLLDEKLATVSGIIEQFGQYTGEISNLYSLETINLDKKEKLEFLYSNFYFTWNSTKGNYIDQLYGMEWSRNQSPIDVLRQVDNPVLDKFYSANKLNIENSIRLQETYLKKETWFDKMAKHDETLARLEDKPIAYFSLEFGLADWLQIYSGGLGVLAGDTMKEASDSGLPLVGLGLFYTYGYFYQRFNEDGYQIDDYLYQDTDDYPMETIKDKDGLTIVVDVKLGEKIIKVRAWRLKVGRRSLILLDTNFPENKEMEDRMITYHLYGGDEDTRIKQEIILAMGGYEILKALNITPSILHLNEGHSAFVILAKATDLMKNEGMNFQDAIDTAKKYILFTNHTLKQAGNDIFEYDLVKTYMHKYAEDMNIDFGHIFALGADEEYAEGKFSMTTLGLNNASKINAVSNIHAVAAKSLWPNHELTPVTNGVHMSTWVSEPIHSLLDEYVGERWNEQGAKIDWEKIKSIPDEKLWAAHISAKNLLLTNLEYNCELDIPDDSLIFCWFRRLASYKQPEILTLDLERLDKLINDTNRPVRFVFGGKAHPRDGIAKDILQEMYKLTQEDRFKGKFILVPDYNWRMARYMVSGSDVWINSPIRLQEACGTSGMKAAANGSLQFSTIDGWIDEVKDEGMIWEIQDELNADQYFSTIENLISPLYWNRNEKGVPVDWVARMKQTMMISLSRYGTDRMLRDYIETLYRPILKSTAV